jgi:hypothetical protein
MNGRKIVLLLVLVTVALVILVTLVSPSLSPPAALHGGLLSAINTDASTVDNTVNVLQDITPQTMEQRIVLKDATLQIMVTDVTATLDAIAKMADDMGGWVINSNTSKASRASGDDAVTGSIAIRVPAAQLDAALTQIKNQATSVDSETITGKDVTQEFTDLNSQLTNLQAAEKQLQTILDSASTTDDVLKIYDELVRVRGEIETTQGRINYYKEASSFSSISVSLRPPTVAQAAVEVDTGWSPGTTVKGAFNALVNILQGLANLIIIVVVLVLPLVLVIGIPAWLINRLLRRFGWIKSPLRASAVSNPPSNTQVENDVG